MKVSKTKLGFMSIGPKKKRNIWNGLELKAQIHNEQIPNLL